MAKANNINSASTATGTKMTITSIRTIMAGRTTASEAVASTSKTGTISTRESKGNTDMTPLAPSTSVTSPATRLSKSFANTSTHTAITSKAPESFLISSAAPNGTAI